MEEERREERERRVQGRCHRGVCHPVLILNIGFGGRVIMEVKVGGKLHVIQVTSGIIVDVIL
jgi:hypothetical protein